jgi:hypothetical protein
VFSNQTNAIIATFTAVATTVCFTGCGQFDGESNENYKETTLVDDNGNPYTLTKNSDGTETAKYEDGKEVTFKRNDDGNMDFISGNPGLIAALAASYFLFHGMGYPGGYYTGNNYYSNSRPERISWARQQKSLNQMERKISSNHTGIASTGVKPSNSSNTNTVKQSNPSTAKSGFGSAGGVRSSSGVS